MRYNLSSNQAHRINYDAANGDYFDDQIAQYVAAGGHLDDIDRSTFNAWFNIEQENVDDAEEAEARAWSVFQQRLAAARAAQPVGDATMARMFYAVVYAYGRDVVNHGNRPDQVYRFDTIAARQQFIRETSGDVDPIAASHPLARKALRYAAQLGAEWPIAV